MKVTTDSCLFGAWCATLIQNTTAKRALDIGAGTGLLSLMIAQKNSISIDAVEIEEAAFEQLHENVLASPFKDVIRAHHNNILDFHLSGYDVIISNPPFYENELTSYKEEKNIAHHSQQLKLKELFKILAEKLTQEGNFFLLLPYKRWHEVQNMLNEFHLFAQEVVVVKPSVHHAPFRVLLKGGKSSTTLIESEIAIKDEEHNYTAAFVSLLKDYYLYL